MKNRLERLTPKVGRQLGGDASTPQVSVHEGLHRGTRGPRKEPRGMAHPGVFKPQGASEQPARLVKTQITGPQPQFALQSVWGRPENLHFHQVPRRCCCCWSQDHTGNLPGKEGDEYPLSEGREQLFKTTLGQAWSRVHTIHFFQSSRLPNEPCLSGFSTAE